MYTFPRKFAAAASAALFSLSLLGCSAVQPAPSAENTSTAAAEQTAAAGDEPADSAEQDASAEVGTDVPTQTDFSDKDTTDTWAAGTPEIKLNGDSVSADSPDVRTEGSKATVSGAGSYLVSGSLTDGQIIVEAGEQDDVQLILNGADITCSDGPAIHVKSADKVILTLAAGRNNSVADGTVYSDTSEEAPSAAIYAEEDLSINGTGSLTVTANNNNGIATKDDLVIVDGSLTVTAPNHALKGKDSVSIGGGFHFPGGNGEFSFGDGQMPDFGGQAPDSGFGFGEQRPDDSDAGFDGQMPDGDFGFGGQMPDGNESGFGGPRPGRRPGMTDEGMTADDSIQPAPAEPSAATSADPELRETAAPSEDAGQSLQGAAGRKSRPARPDAETSATEMRPESSDAQNRPASSTDAASSESAATSSDSCKGIKAGGNILIDGGVFDLNCADDGVHSDAGITLTGGKFRIDSGDDGIHAEADLIIRTDVEITESYEGIEGLNVQIEDGTISVKSSDDGVNAAGDGGHPSVNVSGGVLNVQSGGDGIDSNGEINVSGGDVQVLIRSSADNCAMDAETSFTVTGGNLIYGGTGTGSGPQNGSSQSYVYASGSFPAGETVTLRQNGQDLMHFTPEIDCSSLIFSQPGIEAGASYEVYAGSTLAATATAGQGGSGMFGGGRGGQNRFGGGFGSAAQPETTDGTAGSAADATARPTLPNSISAADASGAGTMRPRHSESAAPESTEPAAAETQTGE